MSRVKLIQIQWNLFLKGHRTFTKEMAVNDLQRRDERNVNTKYVKKRRSGIKSQLATQKVTVNGRFYYFVKCGAI